MPFMRVEVPYLSSYFLPGALGFDPRNAGCVSAHSTLVLRRAVEIHTRGTSRTPEGQRVS